MLEIIRGDTENLIITFKDNEGNAIDLTNTTVYFTVKEQLSDTDANAVIKKTVTTHSDPTNGETTIELTPAETATFPVKNLYYDVSVKWNTTGAVMSIPPQQLKVVADVTRDV